MTHSHWCLGKQGDICVSVQLKLVMNPFTLPAPQALHAEQEPLALGVNILHCAS